MRIFFGHNTGATATVPGVITFGPVTAEATPYSWTLMGQAIISLSEVAEGVPGGQSFAGKGMLTYSVGADTSVPGWDLVGRAALIFAVSAHAAPGSTTMRGKCVLYYEPTPAEATPSEWTLYGVNIMEPGGLTFGSVAVSCLLTEWLIGTPLELRPIMGRSRPANTISGRSRPSSGLSGRSRPRTLGASTPVEAVLEGESITETTLS